MSTLSVTTIRDVQNFESTVVGTVFLTANAAFGRANTALQNTSGTFAGTLSTSGGISVTGNMASIAPSSIGVYLGRDPGAANNAGIDISCSATGYGWLDFNSSTGIDYKGRIGYDISNDIMHLVTNGVIRQQIDSAGRITMPFQPAWVAYGSSESWYNTVGVVPFNNANYTRNCSYDTTNSRFTAPISGLYNISWSFLAGTNGNAGHISLRKNAAYIIEVMHGQSSAAEYDYTGGSMPVYLASGDYVDMYMSATFSSGIYMGSNAGRYAVFSGFLIG